MSFRPQIQERETVLVQLGAGPRGGRRFDLLLTDRQLAHSRSRLFRSVETVVALRREIKDARLRAESPWLHWALAFGLFAAFVGYFQMFLTRDAGMPSGLSLLLPAAGAACLILGRPRWVLQWRARDGIHRLALPSGLDARDRYRLTNALRPDDERATEMVPARREPSRSVKIARVARAEHAVANR